jgi:hypothetical protein
METKADSDTVPGQVGQRVEVMTVDTARRALAIRARRDFAAGSGHDGHGIRLGNEVIQAQFGRVRQQGGVKQEGVQRQIVGSGPLYSLDAARTYLTRPLSLKSILVANSVK